MAHDNLTEIWTRGHPRPRLLLLEGSHWRHQRDTLNNLLYVTICVLFHPTGSGRNPPAQCRELLTIRLMPRNIATLLQFSLKVLPPDSCLNARDHIVFVDPYDLAHPAHIQTNDHPPLLRFLTLLQVKGLSHIGTTAIWNQDHVVVLG